jgi:hypothetical protein
LLKPSSFVGKWRSLVAQAECLSGQGNDQTRTFGQQGTTFFLSYGACALVLRLCLSLCVSVGALL